MRVQTEEWRRFIPGVRMYKGKLTYFYNGEERPWEIENDEDENDDSDSDSYDSDTDSDDSEEEERRRRRWKKRQKWEVMIVLPGVEVIPEWTFYGCHNVKTVIMSDSVRRIEKGALMFCHRLKFVRLSKTLEYIGKSAFFGSSLTSIFIPESCREIDDNAFSGCERMVFLSVPRHTRLGVNVFANTALIRARASHFETIEYGHYDRAVNDEVNEWIQNLNQAEQFALHRECASTDPSENSICEIIQQQGLPSINVKNQIGRTALEYLQKNPYTEIDQQKLIKRLVLDLMGEIIA